MIKYFFENVNSFHTYNEFDGVHSFYPGNERLQFRGFGEMVHSYVPVHVP